MANTWNDDLKQEARSMYLERINEFEEADRPKMSTEVVSGIATELGFTKNSVRATLQRMKTDSGEEVYIRASTTPKASATTGNKRMSKADAIAEMKAAIKDLGAVEFTDEFDEAIKSITGKAAQAIASAIRSA